ncbi:hypothetical protein Hanom_Chr06g00498081 [Helianthus anomalus]
MCFELSRFRFVFVSVRDLVPARRLVNKSAGIRVKFASWLSLVQVLVRVGSRRKLTEELRTSRQDNPHVRPLGFFSILTCTLLTRKSQRNHC